MENIRVFEEGGYIHFILRPEELMRLRYSEQSTIAFSAFMDGWLGQMKTQVRQNTMDGYRYAFEKHIRPFFDARGMTLATARPMDFQDFVNFKFEQGLSPTSMRWPGIVSGCCMTATSSRCVSTARAIAVFRKSAQFGCVTLFPIARACGTTQAKSA
mgnify:CR=1 FL=1